MIPGVSLLDLQATQRHQRLSELSQAGARFLERSDWLASCTPWRRTYRGHYCMALTRIGPEHGIAALAPGVVVGCNDNGPFVD